MADEEVNAQRAFQIMDSRACGCLGEPKFFVSYADAQQWAVEPDLRLFEEQGRERDFAHDPAVSAVLMQYELSKEILKNLERFHDWEYEYAVGMADADLLIGALYWKIGRTTD